MLSGVVKKLADDQKKKKVLDLDQAGRIKRIEAGCTRVQRQLLKDKSKYISIRCPRRSGKSFSMTSKALHIGESIPFSRILIISLSLKSTKENFWSGPGGIKFQNSEYTLDLKFNETDCVWYHQNGSRGRLAGAETRADIEYLRGAAAEADVVLIDECKSFAPELLRQLIRDVVEPGLMTREGVLIMGGTPGNIPIGEFFRATQLNVKVSPDQVDGMDTCYLYSGKSRTDDTWSLHTWTIEDNTAKKHQWNRALRIKQKSGWTDFTPVWRREYLGEWVTDTTELVYSYSNMKLTGKVNWVPEYGEKISATGLPESAGPWRLVMGLDFGFEDMNAIVLAAYSETVQELRHVYDFKKNHMTIDEFGQEISYTIQKFGVPEVIIGDKGSLGGVLYIQELNSRFGLGIIEAEKREKYDHIEMLNSDFYSGRVKIIENTDLEFELCSLQWDLSKNLKDHLIRTGKLKEDPSCPNHLCDAFLYLWRYCTHYWAKPEEPVIDSKSPDWYINKEKENIQKYKDRLAGLTDNELTWMDNLRNRDRETGNYLITDTVEDMGRFHGF